jgi:hypothetical protein
MSAMLGSIIVTPAAHAEFPRSARFVPGRPVMTPIRGLRWTGDAPARAAAVTKEVAMDARPPAAASGRSGHLPGVAAVVPLAWAVLLLFHPAPDEGDVFGSLREEGGTWLAVHLGSLLFVGLTGAVLLLLLAELRGPVAALGRVGVGAFVLCYGAAEAISGVATGTLVQHGSGLPPDGQAGAAGAVQALWDSFIADDLLFLVGSVGWVVAVVAAAVASRRAGAPLLASVLLALSAVAVFHAPPIGPVGLLLLAVAMVVLARGSRAAVAAGSGQPA